MEVRLLSKNSQKTSVSSCDMGPRKRPCLCHSLANPRRLDPATLLNSRSATPYLLLSKNSTIVSAVLKSYLTVKQKFNETLASA